MCRIILEQSAEFNSPLYLTFVDFKQAFDRLDQNAIWRILQSKGVPQKIIRILRELYHNSTCTVMHKTQNSQMFATKSGMHTLANVI